MYCGVFLLCEQGKCLLLQVFMEMEGNSPPFLRLLNLLNPITAEILLYCHQKMGTLPQIVILKISMRMMTNYLNQLENLKKIKIQKTVTALNPTTKNPEEIMGDQQAYGGEKIRNLTK